MADTADGDGSILWLAAVGLGIFAIGTIAIPRIVGELQTEPRRGRADTHASPTVPAPARGRATNPVPGGHRVSAVSQDPRVAAWQTLVRQLIASEFPRVDDRFAMAWLAMESGGNAVAVGDPGRLGQGSQEPAEIGLGQLYNPDDFHAFGIDPAAFRAYAPAAAPLAAQYNQLRASAATATAAGDTTTAATERSAASQIARQMQTATRELTPSEKADQVRWTLLAKIRQSMAKADTAVSTYGLRGWSLPDYWKLVKAPHALPAILNEGMPAVVKKLGRAPVSWAEFRSALGMDAMIADADGKTVPKYPQWVRALNACEACGDATAQAVA